MSKRPSFGRSKSERGFDQFDTPPIALEPLFTHEPLLAGVRTICEPFCGLGNLVTAIRQRGLIVHASDIQDRGCPDLIVLDFLDMTERPPDCHTLLSNPPYGITLDSLEHAFALEFRLVILLLKIQFLHSKERFCRLYPRGYLRRVYPIAERLQGMHDAAHIAKGGKQASQPQDHAWFIFDRNYCGDAACIPVSINDPEARMPWQTTARCSQCRQPYQPQRLTARYCSAACKQQAYRTRLSVTSSVTPPTVTPSVTPVPSDGVYEFRYVGHTDLLKFETEGWERLTALDQTHHAEYASLMRRRIQQDGQSLIG